MLVLNSPGVREEKNRTRVFLAFLSFTARADTSPEGDREYTYVPCPLWVGPTCEWQETLPQDTLKGGGSFHRAPN